MKTSRMIVMGVALTLGACLIAWLDPDGRRTVAEAEDGARNGAPGRIASLQGPDCVAAPLVATEHAVSTTTDFPNSVVVADVDGDDDLDIIASSAFDDTIVWYENDGVSPPEFTMHVITDSADNVVGVFAADLNGDGDVDVVAAVGSENQIAWYENDGLPAPGFTEHVITDTVELPKSVYAIDLDGDLDIDVLSASNNDSTIAWYQNDGENPPSFTMHIISTTALLARSVFAADVNGDGDIDVLSASNFDDTIAWYESNGAATPTFTKHEIFESANGAESVFAADMDGDGDIDVLSASTLDSTLRWYENKGGLSPSFTMHVVAGGLTGVRAVFAIDFDDDNDTDIIAAVNTGDRVDWWENDGGSPPTFSLLISADADGPQSVTAADLDENGTINVVAAIGVADTVAWYEIGEPTLGACCLSDGSCQEDTCLLDCSIAAGWGWHAETACAAVTCPSNDATPAAFLVDALNLDRFKETIADLVAFESRYWNRPGNALAVEYIRAKLESFGYDNVVLDPYQFSGQTMHNVYATKMGTVRATEMYILGAHLDSFNKLGDLDDAPGADDDGAGTASVLEMARVFANAKTEVSIRFALWNNEETGLDGSEAYVENHRKLQGTLEEPTWLGMIQQDMILYDHGPGLVPDADVEFQTTADAGGAALIFAEFVSGAMPRYGEVPAEVGNNMAFTDSVSFQDLTTVISVRENERVAEIGEGSNPHWHHPTDVPETYTEADYFLGFNIVKMICGAIGEAAGAVPLGDYDGDLDIDLMDYEEFLNCVTGPGGGILPDCDIFDFDGDDDVDFEDLGRLQAVFTG